MHRGPIQTLRQRSRDLLTALDHDWVLVGGTLTCKICYDDFDRHSGFEFTGCKHFFCQTCSTAHIKHKYSDFATSTITCPSPSCAVPVSSQDLASVLTTNEIEKLEARMLSRVLSKDPNYFRCPGTNCNNGTILSHPNRRGRRNEKTHCPPWFCVTCNVTYCTHCRELDHPEMTCAALMRLQRARDTGQGTGGGSSSNNNTGGGGDDMEKLIHDGTVQPCPNCGAAVMTSGGCNHVVCSACSLPFIWNKSGQSSSAKHVGRPSPRSFNEWLRILALCLLLLLPLLLWAPWAHHLWNRAAAGEKKGMQTDNVRKDELLDWGINTVTAQYLLEITRRPPAPSWPWYSVCGESKQVCETWYTTFGQYDWCGIFSTLSCIGTTLEEIQLRGSAGTLVSTHGVVGLFCFFTFYGLDWVTRAILSCVEWVLASVVTRYFLFFFSTAFLAYATWEKCTRQKNKEQQDVATHMPLICIVLATAWFGVLYPSGLLCILWGTEWYVRRPAHALMAVCFALVHAGPRWRQMARNWIN